MYDQYYSVSTDNKNLYMYSENASRPFSTQNNFHRGEIKPLQYQPNANQKMNPVIKYSGTAQLQAPISYQTTLLPNVNRNRYMPYNNRTFSFQNGGSNFQSSHTNQTVICNRNNYGSTNNFEHNVAMMQTLPKNRIYSMPTYQNTTLSNMYSLKQQNEGSSHQNVAASISIDLSTQQKNFVTLQISNLDNALEEANLKSFLLAQLKPITPIVSLVFEGSTYVKVTVPDLNVSIRIPFYNFKKNYFTLNTTGRADDFF